MTSCSQSFVRSCWLWLVWLDAAAGCSYVEVAVPDDQAINGSRYIIGRTMELGSMNPLQAFYSDSQWQVAVHPRGHRSSQLGFVSVENFRLKGALRIVTEGMNEAGLTVSVQTLTESEYEDTDVVHALDVSTVDLAPALLASCHDVAATMAFLEAHRIVGRGGMIGVHWAIADASGRSIVLEYLRGKRTVYENTPRVMTNDPPLDWHWRNLNTYVNLSPLYPRANDFLGVSTSVGTVPKAIGHGWNLAGLPGDGSPPSRFVQLFYLRGYSMHRAAPKSTDDAIVLTTGLLNKVFIPFGSIAENREVLVDTPEYTPWAVLKIPAERRLLFRGYRDLHWRQVDLNNIDFGVAVQEAPAWHIESGSLGIEDVALPPSLRV